MQIMKRYIGRGASLLCVLALLCAAVSCVLPTWGVPDAPVRILSGDEITLAVGESAEIQTNFEGERLAACEWTVSSECVTVEGGVVTGRKVGTATVIVRYLESMDSVTVVVTDRPIVPPDDGDDVVPPSEDPYVGMSKSEFYKNYTVATSYEDAMYRTEHGFLSGSREVPDDKPTVAAYRPKLEGKYVKNTDMRYTKDAKGYIVTDSYGRRVLTVWRGAAYITLEEVAAHMYAFGTLPANYTSKKSGKPSSSIWGEYLRLNHSYFSGDTDRYPYEPKLPDISGCGGSLRYYEMDIGTTGTHTDGYASKIYNNGTKITRGAARIVYARNDKNGNGIFEQGEIYLFYTYNHYNDFQEYLNYYGGWGEMFGNVTGGGTLSSEYDYNPTPYVKVYYGTLTQQGWNGPLDLPVIPAAYWSDERRYAA